ncbi:MAG TPA: sialate O-acetylesterase, partial [Chitinophagaceae bacterium]|nr:sialate O-acetylesterase [Chitinophagaceae bacterium]
TQLRLPAIISSGMVLQQNDSATLWGWGTPGERIAITPGWSEKTDTTVVNNRANWKIKLRTPVAGGPYTITLKGNSTITLNDVMIGEVWVCSGQSNMEWSYRNGLQDIKDELPASYNPNIRFFHIPKTTANHPQDDVKAEWKICDSNSLKSFSAVGYFFGKKLNKQLNVPVGLINASWGGTPAEVWTPESIFDNDEELRLSAARLQSFRWWPNHDGLCYNAMIDPITKFNIAGTIWYQGESNIMNNDTYHKLFTTMIKSWRDAWKKDFPFYYVQIAPFKYGTNNVAALIQEAQTKAMNFPNTGMVVITDLVESTDELHPKNKHDVGLRLANWALAETYKQKGIAYKSPMYKSKTTNGGKITLSFDNIPKGFRENEAVAGFSVFDTRTEQWYDAQAKIEKDKIIVWSEKAVSPSQVRYAFGNTIIGNVFSKEGLPLCPFRTDNWEVDQSPVK